MCYVYAILACMSPLSVSAKEPVKPAVPIKTSVTYGDWVVRCRESKPQQETDNTSEVPADVCEMTHAIRFSVKDAKTGKVGKPTLFAQIAIGRVPKTDTIKVVIQSPAAVWLRDGVELRFSSEGRKFEDVTGAYFQKASFFRCVTNWCLADYDLNDAKLQAIKGSKLGQLSLIDTQRRTIKVPISLRGFAEAYDAFAH